MFNSKSWTLNQCLYERDWLLPARCLYPSGGVCRVPLMGRSFKQTNKQTNSYTGHSQRSKVFDFFPREENRTVWKTLIAQQRTNVQLNSHMAPVTLVRGERLTHKPTMPPVMLSIVRVGLSMRTTGENGENSPIAGAIFGATEHFTIFKNQFPFPSSVGTQPFT